MSMDYSCARHWTALLEMDGWAASAGMAMGQNREEARVGRSREASPTAVWWPSSSTVSTWTPLIQILVAEERQGGEVGGGGREARRGGAGAERLGGSTLATRRVGGRRGREP
uniref:Uncharacterized protein n=1 Tax=Triticum urartu TaxID=4572 RepID=A0A8R7PRH1_TRIUA